MFTKYLLVFCVFISSVQVYTNGSEVFSDAFANDTGETNPSLQLSHFGKKSYYIGNIFKGNFFHAQQFCRYHGMHLLSIATTEENEFVKEEISKSGDGGKSFWTSGTRLPDSQKWIWMSTGKSVVFSSWDNGEPKDKDKECIEILISNENLVWKNVDCWEDLYFVCESSWPNDCIKLFHNLPKNATVANILPQIDVRNGI
ncbi:hypothetical protein JTB14_001413 [Gonioctena quinquepunctata]|nr:hypothetical protein JTB14_001413 [Gonioctena quinquepunctata]